MWRLHAHPKPLKLGAHACTGYMLIVLNFALMLLFLKLIHRTYIFEKRVVKRNFYRRFAFLYTLWFLHIPILVLISVTTPTYLRYTAPTPIQPSANEPCMSSMNPSLNPRAPLTCGMGHRRCHAVVRWCG